MLSSELKSFATKANANESLAEAAQDQLLMFQSAAKEYNQNVAAAKQLEKQLAEATSDPEEQAPDALLAQFDALKIQVINAVAAIESVIFWVQSRWPQEKAEDNLGVAVAEKILKDLFAMQALLESPDEKRRFCTVRAKSSYLKARTELEKALREAAKPPKDKDDVPPAVGASTKLLLKQIDVDAASDIARSFTLLHRMSNQAALLVARNFQSLNQPRREGGSSFIG